MKNIFSILLLLFVFASCERNVEEDSIGNVEGEVATCDPEISFAQNINPIMTTYCVECHRGNRSPDLRTFNGISGSASNIRAEVVSRRMPQGSSLTNEEIELISCWIDNGALNN